MNNEFIECLSQQYESVKGFGAVLEEEQALLATSRVDRDSLIDVIERKSKYASELEALERKRHDILIANGYSPDRLGAEDYVKVLGCHALWRSFLEAVNQAQTQNRLNGLSIQTRLDFHQRALQFLQNAAGMSLYGPNGQKRGLSSKSIYSRV